ncbi:hypothetical protein [Psychroserpens algicola]|uniref:Adhesin domain-containing protein n=1 Tax=Psychroserpens algicola TaxID=1719034 RepID=A0ABT0H6D7_9FLAO|nr:hypothetical protein [Psychroserpens algicola]MCK8479589.1 hypothetical protein [Psychroserpens algicola]
MKNIYQIFLLLFVCCILNVSAQEKLEKISKRIDVTKDVSIDLSTSYVQIEIDTWNKNTVEVEAYIEGEKLSKEDLQKALNDWNLKVEGSGSNVKISSQGGLHGSWSDLGDININLESLKALEVLGDLHLAELPELPEIPELPELPEMPEMPEIPEMPELPELPELPNGITSVSFDSEAYKKDGEKYLESWSKDYPAKDRERMKAWAREMGTIDFTSYERKMSNWGERFGEKFGEKFGKDYEAKMEEWGEKFSKQFDEEWASKMEAWGEKYGKEMEKRSKELEKHMAKREKEMEKRHERLAERMEERHKANEKRHESRALRFEKREHDVRRTIKIKMPKGAKLNLNVRHGELKMASVIQNLKADISHATLVANHIDGSETSINVSYSPVNITTWSNGELNLKYVEDAHLSTVNRLRLNSNSSDMFITTLIGNAIIDGSFGDLSIANISDAFSSLNIILENSEAVIKLPSTTTDYSMYFKGNRSRLNNEMTTQQTINNYPNSNASGKSIVINAKFSDVVLKD